MESVKNDPESTLTKAFENYLLNCAQNCKAVCELCPQLERDRQDEMMDEWLMLESDYAPREKYLGLHAIYTVLAPKQSDILSVPPLLKSSVPDLISRFLSYYYWYINNNGFTLPEGVSRPAPETEENPLVAAE